MAWAEDTADKYLTKARDVLNLSVQEAKRGYPVQLKGVVLCYDHDWDLCFLSDSSASVYLWRVSRDLGLRGGELMEVYGATSGGKFSPIVIVTNAVVLGRVEKPVPRPVSIQELNSASLDSQWIEVSGIVHSEPDFSGRWSLDLVSGEDHLSVLVLTNKPSSASYRDARVRIHGIAMAQGNEQGQLTKYSLAAPSVEDVEVIEPAAKEPFSMPAIPGRSLLSHSARENWDRQVRVQGVVTLHVPGDVIFLKDHSGGYRVRTNQTRLLKPGTRLEVLGYASRAGITPQIVDPIIREGGLGPLPKPIVVGERQPLNARLDCEMIEVVARLVNLESSQETYPILHLKTEQDNIKAFVLPRFRPGKRPSWILGSQLRLTGICTVSAREDPARHEYTLWVGSMAGIEVLRQPQEWIGRQVIWTIGLAGAAIGLGLGWALILRRQVGQQIAVLKGREAVLETRYRDLFENAHDVIFTHDMKGCFSSVNKAGELLLGRSQADLQGLNLVDFLVAESKGRYQCLLAEHARGVERQTCELELHIGTSPLRIWEVDTRLDYLEGCPVGIRGIARDITQRKQSEEALRRSEHELRHSLEERQRIAQDLHDDIIQSIYAIGLGLEDCRKRLAQDTQQAEKRLRNCMNELNRLIRKVRTFIGHIDTGTLSSSGFVVELQSLLSTMSDQSQARVELNVDPLAVARLSPEQVPQLLQIARECISNSLRHSQSSRIQLSLQALNGKIHLEIRDDGTGFDMATAAQKGNGLRNITARACQLGAQLNIESRLGSGTSIAIDFTPDVSIYASN